MLVFLIRAPETAQGCSFCAIMHCWAQILPHSWCKSDLRVIMVVFYKLYKMLHFPLYRYPLNISIWEPDVLETCK